MSWARVLRRNLFQHPGRTLVVGLAVVIGVAIFVGVSEGSATVTRAIGRLGPGDRPAGIELEASGARGATVDAAVVARVRSLPDVAGVTGLLVGEIDPPGAVGPVPVEGLDGDALAGLRIVRGRSPTPGADELAIGERSAGVFEIDVGDAASVGGRALRVVGLVAAGDSANEVFAPVELVRSLRGLGEVFDSVQVQLVDGTDRGAWLDSHADELGGLRVGDGPVDDDAVEFFESIEASLAPLAASSLLVGGFLIHLAMTRTIRDRHRVHGVLRAIGASRRAVVLLVLAEAVAVGIVGSAVGIGLGLVLADGIGSVMAGLFDIRLADGGPGSFPVVTVVVAFVAGSATAVIAAVLPAVRAARTDPATAMRPPEPGVPRHGRRALAGAALVVAGVASTSLASSETVAGITGAAAMIGVLLLAPAAVAPAASLVRRLARGRLRGAAELATAELARAGSRAPASAGILAATLTLVMVVATVIASQRPAFVDAIEANLGADAVIPVFTTSVGSSDGADEQLLDLLGRSASIAAVTPVGTGRVEVLEPGGGVEPLTIIDLGTYFDVSDFAWTHGTEGPEAIAALEAGGVLVASEIASTIGLELGDTVRLRTVSGPATFAVAGLYYGFAFGDTNALVVSETTGRAEFGYTEPDRVLADLAAPAEGEAGIQIHAGTTSIGGSGFNSHAQLRADILAQYDGLWALVQVVLVLIGLTGLLGLANAMVMEVLDRGHRLGVLRAIGMQRRTVQGVVLLEGVAIAVVAGLVAVVSGSALGRALITESTGGVDLSIEPRFPAAVVPLALAIAVGVGIVAGAVPAHRAARLDPAEAIRVGLGD